MITSIITAVTAGIGLSIIVGGAYLVQMIAKKKGKAAVDIVQPVAKKAETVLMDTDKVAEVITPLLPSPLQSKAKVVTKVIKSAVGIVEDLSTGMNPTISDEQRKSKATDMINTALQFEGISPDDVSANLVSALIDFSVRFLPKSHTQTAASVPASASGTSVKVKL